MTKRLWRGGVFPFKKKNSILWALLWTSFGTDCDKKTCYGHAWKNKNDFQCAFYADRISQVCGPPFRWQVLGPISMSLTLSHCCFEPNSTFKHLFFRKERRKNCRKILVKDFEQVWGGNFIFKSSTWLVLLGWTFLLESMALISRQRQRDWQQTW